MFRIQRQLSHNNMLIPQNFVFGLCKAHNSHSASVVMFNFTTQINRFVLNKLKFDFVITLLMLRLKHQK